MRSKFERSIFQSAKKPLSDFLCPAAITSKPAVLRANAEYAPKFPVAPKTSTLFIFSLPLSFNLILQHHLIFAARHNPLGLSAYAHIQIPSLTLHIPPDST